MTLKDTAREQDMLDEAVAVPVAKAPPPKPKRLEEINTLHELLALAIGDMEKVLADKRYYLNMGEWHNPDSGPNGRCQVCAAGSVMAISLKADNAADVTPWDFSAAAGRRLAALNELRQGTIRDAYDALHDNHRSHWRWPEHLLTKLHDLDNKWTTRLSGVASAIGAKDGRRLVRKLKVMQRDLERAGL